MTLRNLVLCFALAAAACTLPPNGQLPCKTPSNNNNNNECPTGQTCGSDLLCRDVAAACPGITKPCGGDCVDITKDPFNCGGCNTVCAAGEQCVADSAGVPKCTTYCAPGQTACAQPGTSTFICKDLASDRNNCGTCGTVCGTGLVCSPPAIGKPGKCSIECLPGLTNCSGNCLDATSDPLNCGGCGVKCDPGLTCRNSACTVICTPGLTQCGAAGSSNCVDVDRDRDNCGGCGVKCSAGQICVTPAGGVPGCAVSCQAGLTLCGNSCIDTTVDPKNCGGCGNASGTPTHICGASEVCVAGGANGAGVCEQKCPAGQTLCNGLCTSFQTDRANCGACSTTGNSHACNPGELCTTGSCAVSCSSGLANCSGACVNTINDPANCGGCGQACTGGKVCTADAVTGIGHCTTACPSSESNCGGSCVDTTSDRANCGGCGTPCGAGQVCSGSGCMVQCPAGSVACNGTCVNPLTDDAHCGGCPGTACSATSGTSCQNGSCKPTCDSARLTNCPGTGCIDTLDDSKNCGTCGSACAAGQSCSGGVCGTTCPAGQQLCGATCKDTTADSANCGGCGTLCGPSQVCSKDPVTGKGACTANCPSGLTACGGTCVNFSYDPANCGGCGASCPATPANASSYCASGSCALTCKANFADCNTSAVDGCEVNLTTDASHCGTCVNACKGKDNSTASCTAGTCDSPGACVLGFNNCDADASNGCESNQSFDAAHCGACPGVACSSAASAAHYCVSGACNAAIAGVQQNLPIASVLDDRWTQCWPPIGTAETYSSTGTTLAQIQAACGAASVLFACRAPGSSLLTLAAAGARSDVFFATGAGATVSHVAAGIAWYFDGSSSIGFAPAGASINRAPCDTAGGAADGYAAGFGSQRLCWPTQSGALIAGARCGDREGTGATSTYERLVFTK